MMIKRIDLKARLLFSAFMAEKPIISVITPCYNLQEYLHRTIESVQEQTLTDWEMIIVDDCSTDDSIKIARQYAQNDPRIHVITLDENSGSSKARNVGLDFAKGRFITFIDGDDLIMPNKFQDQIAFMKDNSYGITYTNYRRITPDEKQTGILIRNPDTINYNYLLKHTAMGTLTPIYDSDIIGNTYRFDETLPARMDYLFWLTILKDGYTAYRFDEDLARYRRGHTSLSSNLHRGQKIVWDIYRNRLGFNFAQASWYYIHYVCHALKKRRAY